MTYLNMITNLVYLAGLFLTILLLGPHLYASQAKRVPLELIKCSLAEAKSIKLFNLVNIPIYISSCESGNCVSNSGLNPLTAKLFNLNFHKLEVVSR